MPKRLFQFIYDPCSAILFDALREQRLGKKSDADRAWRARTTAERRDRIAAWRAARASA
jgi:hypothetical protein